MDPTTSAPSDPVVMAEQIQALTANVQELMKQNEDLKRKAHPEGTSMSSLGVTATTMMMKPIT